MVTHITLTLCHGNTTILACMPVMDNIHTFDLSCMHVHTCYPNAFLAGKQLWSSLAFG